MIPKRAFIVVGGKLSVRDIIVLGIAMATFITLIKFHDQYNDASIKADTLQKQLDHAQVQVVEMERVSAQAKKFIQSDCRFQYFRTTNIFTRYNKLISIDTALYSSDLRLADLSDIASHYWANKGDPIVGTYWRGMALEGHARAIARHDQLTLDQDSLKALGKTATIDPACAPPKTTLNTFIRPTNTPAPPQATEMYP